MIGGVGNREGLFVAGTDTGVGKTLVAAGVIRLALDQGLRVHGLKPVETGCKASTDGLFPEDGAFLVGASDGSISLEDCTPFRFSLPASPYRAATQEGQHITISSLEEHVLKMASTVDCIIVEGAGGLMVPVEKHRLMIDLMVRLAFPVLLVARTAIGTLNHTLLSLEALKHRGIETVGIVLSRGSVAPGPEEKYTPEDLAAFTSGTPVFVLPYMDAQTRADPRKIAKALEIIGIKELLFLTY